MGEGARYLGGLVIVVEVPVSGAWVNETREYFLKTGHAIAAAARYHRQDRRSRRVATWPGGEQVWHTGAMQRRVVDVAAARRAVFGTEEVGA